MKMKKTKVGLYITERALARCNELAKSNYQGISAFVEMLIDVYYVNKKREENKDEKIK